ncbi:MAG TPA: hypothetical protein ACFYD7_12630 [Candidatus Wujingus californicus]|uniref:hypothetical protein n=1 Tax=Candidatus Wujingus californicus TaxID=3367618 RepID=UPI00402A2C28
MKTEIKVYGKHKRGIPIGRLWFYSQLGLSFSEIGRLCGCTKQSVWKRLKNFQKNKALYDEVTQKWAREILEKSSSTCRLP